MNLVIGCGKDRKLLIKYKKDKAKTDKARPGFRRGQGSGGKSRGGEQGMGFLVGAYFSLPPITQAEKCRLTSVDVTKPIC